MPLRRAAAAGVGLLGMGLAPAPSLVAYGCIGFLFLVIAAWLTTFFAHAIPRPQPDPIDDQLLPAAISPPFGACFLTDLIDFKAGQIAHPSDTCGFSHYWETQTTGKEDLVVPNWSVGIQYVTNGTHQSGSKTVTCQIVATASGLWHPRFTWSLGWPGASVKPLSADGAMVSITFLSARLTTVMDLSRTLTA